MSRSQPPLDGPTFIVGSGRSGTTLVLNLLVGHPEFAFISRLSDRVPSFPYVAALSRPGWTIGIRGLRPSVEAERTLAYCGLTVEQLITKGSPLDAQDVDPDVEKRLQAVVRGHCAAMGRRHFVWKSTANTMRIQYLAAVFPNARFIHVVRNGYAVCSSLLRVNWWPDLKLWWRGTTPKEWEAEGGNPAHLAGLHWKRQVDAALESLQGLDESRSMEVRYEDLVSNPQDVVGEMVQFAGLEWSPGYDRHFAAVSVSSDHSDAWRARLSRDELDGINDAAEELLEQLNYDVV